MHSEMGVICTNLAIPNWGTTSLESWFIWGESSPFMALFQVSEIIQFTQMDGICTPTFTPNKWPKNVDKHIPAPWFAYGDGNPDSNNQPALGPTSRQPVLWRSVPLCPKDLVQRLLQLRSELLEASLDARSPLWTGHMMGRWMGRWWDKYMIYMILYGFLWWFYIIPRWMGDYMWWFCMVFKVLRSVLWRQSWKNHGVFMDLPWEIPLAWPWRFWTEDFPANHIWYLFDGTGGLRERPPSLS